MFPHSGNSFPVSADLYPQIQGLENSNNGIDVFFEQALVDDYNSCQL